MKYLKYVDVNGKTVVIFVHQILSMECTLNEQTRIYCFGSIHTINKGSEEILKDLEKLVKLQGN